MYVYVLSSPSLLRPRVFQGDAPALHAAQNTLLSLIRQAHALDPSSLGETFLHLYEKAVSGHNLNYYEVSNLLSHWNDFCSFEGAEVTGADYVTLVRVKLE